MDILIHTLSGTATATVIAGLHPCRPSQKTKIVLIGAFAGALPDLDAVSLWSGFDRTIGNFLGLAHSGREIYFGKLWYSHHVFMHSLLCDFLFTLLAVFIGGWMYCKWIKRAPDIWSGIRYLSVYFLTFFLAYFSHLMGDLPTPGGSWGGINLWFPSEEFTGGWGYTWWWNNYDIFLLLSGCTLLNIVVMISWGKWERQLKYLPAWIYMLTIGLICFQLYQRPVNFNETGTGSKEKRSLEIQEEILGPELYHLMRRFDEALPVYF
ncbi:MAG: metal-dependent hydrolase [Bacteroidota bacterium]